MEDLLWNLFKNRFYYRIYIIQTSENSALGLRRREYILRPLFREVSPAESTSIEFRVEVRSGAWS